MNSYGSGAGQFEYFQPNKDGGNGFFPVASLTGPIVKGKLWFSTVYAPQIVDTSRTIDSYTSSAPTRTITQTNTYDSSVRTEYAFARIDTQPSSKLRGFASFLWNPDIQDGVQLGLTSGLASSTPAQTQSALAAQGGRQNSNSVNGQVTWTPTNYLVLNFRAGRSFLNEKLSSYSLPSGTWYRCVGSGTPPPGANCGRNFSTGSTFATKFDVSTRNTFDIDASLVGVNAGGRHNFKFGYQFNRLFNTVEAGYPVTGRIDLRYGEPISISGATPTPGNLGHGQVTRFGTIGEATSKNQSLFVQDSWMINNRVTLNLGVRVENEVVPSFGDSATTKAIEFGWGDKIAPRLGVSFDLTGDGKTKLFASYGWFYDRFKYELPRGSFGGDFFRRDWFEILPARGVAYTAYTIANVTGGATYPVGGRCPITPPVGYSVCQRDFRIATNSNNADIFVTGAVDPNILAARQSEYTVGIERELSRNFLFSARYTHKQIDRAIEDVGVFNAEGSEAYIIGNPGLGLVCEISTSANQPCTKAQRDYDALEIRLDKRATRYFFNASYTYSRLFGNYSGLTSTDEFQRNSPNVNRFFDLPPLGYNANGEPDNGRLATDRPHVFKAYGGYTFDWADNGVNKTTITSFTTIQSGSPLTTIYDLYTLGTTILYGRGDLGRTEMFTETDLAIAHKYKFGRDNRFSVEPYLNFSNLFDENNVLTVQSTISPTTFFESQLVAAGCATCNTEAGIFNTIFNGGGITRFVESHITTNGIGTVGQNNNYKQPNRFQTGRSVRFGVRLSF